MIRDAAAVSTRTATHAEAGVALLRSSTLRAVADSSRPNGARGPARTSSRAAAEGDPGAYDYYVLQARALAGDHAGCLDVIRKFWGAMLDLGATTFWEDFNLDWVPSACPIDRLPKPGEKDIHADFGDHWYKGLRHSLCHGLCHGWASGPTAWLSEHVLGVTPLAPGFAKARVAPRLGGLRWAEGAVPTPRGEIRVRHVASADGGVDSEITAPAGVEIERG